MVKNLGVFIRTKYIALTQRNKTWKVEFQGFQQVTI